MVVFTEGLSTSTGDDDDDMAALSNAARRMPGSRARHMLGISALAPARGGVWAAHLRPRHGLEPTLLCPAPAPPRCLLVSLLPWLRLHQHSPRRAQASLFCTRCSPPQESPHRRRRRVKAQAHTRLQVISFLSRSLLLTSPRACTVCRRLKMKCVGAEQGPPCKRCLASNHECVFEESNRGKRSSKYPSFSLSGRCLTLLKGNTKSSPALSEKWKKHSTLSSAPSEIQASLQA